jgi:hypothetical protein
MVAVTREELGSLPRVRNEPLGLCIPGLRSYAYFHF